MQVICPVTGFTDEEMAYFESLDESDNEMGQAENEGQPFDYSEALDPCLWHKPGVPA